MSVPVGDLYLAITAPGASQAASALRQVDAAADNTAKKVTNAVAGIGKVTGATAQGASKLTGLFTSLGSTGAASLSRIGAGVAALPVPVLAAAATAVVSLGAALIGTTKAADEARASTALLRGVAIDTGRTFAQVREEAEALRRTYGLTHDETVDLMSATGRLADETNGAADSTKVLNAAMITARARGMDAADAAKMVTAAVAGNAEAIRELTGLRPDDLYARYATQLGVSVDALSHVGRQQALVNGLMAEAAARAGDAQAAIDPLTKSQNDLVRATTDLKVAFGDLMGPTRTWLNEMETGLADILTQMVKLGAWGSLKGILTGTLLFDQLKRSREGPDTPSAPSAPGALSLADYMNGVSPKALNLKPLKEAKDTTDQLIHALVALFEARKVDAKQIQLSNTLYEREKKILDDTTQSLERRAKALDRTKQLEKAGVITAMPIQSMREGPLAMDTTAPGFLPKIDVAEGITTFEDAYDAYIAGVLGIISQGQFSKVLSEAMSQEIQAVWGEAMKQDMQSVAMDFALFTRDVFGTALDGIAAGFERGWGSAKDVILGGLGSILKAMGKHLMITGAALKGLLPHLINPFTSGTAMLAAGALIFGAGTALSAIAHGGGGSAGGSVGVGGGIGSLGIGSGATTPQVYTFGQRGLQTPTGAVSRTDGNTYHFTVIGANDPVAQRQIMTLIDNAQSRGLGNGANSRSV